MRIEIKTREPVKDTSVKSLYIIAYAFKILDKRMIEPTLNYFADYFGYELRKK